MRKLVSIKTITNLTPIKDADNIETATINDGWKVVVKKGEFTLYDKCVYFEIDSILPESDPRFAFLMKDIKDLPTENNTIVRGVKLRTIKLKGQISQGLALPLLSFPELNNCDLDNLDSILSIQKYEKPLHADNTHAKGNFPSFIPKTEQERVQNCIHDIDFDKYEWEITKKYDGCSATYYYFNGNTGICSRNLELINDDTQNSVYHQMNKKYHILEMLNAYCVKHKRNLAIQGEIYGKGIQGNPDNLHCVEFIAFDIYDIDKKKYINPIERIKIEPELQKINPEMFLCQILPLYYLHKSIEGFIFEDLSETNILDRLLEMAKKIGGEGLVFKAISDERISFKVINNEYLLKGK